MSLYPISLPGDCHTNLQPEKLTSLCERAGEKEEAIQRLHNRPRPARSGCGAGAEGVEAAGS